MWVMTFWKRTFTNVIFRVSNLANLNPSLKKRNKNVCVGFNIPSPPYLYKYLGWTNVYKHDVGKLELHILEMGAMREPETWDKR